MSSSCACSTSEYLILQRLRIAIPHLAKANYGDGDGMDGEISLDGGQVYVVNRWVWEIIGNDVSKHTHHKWWDYWRGGRLKGSRCGSTRPCGRIGGRVPRPEGDTWRLTQFSLSFLAFFWIFALPAFHEWWKESRLGSSLTSSLTSSFGKMNSLHKRWVQSRAGPARLRPITNAI